MSWKMIWRDGLLLPPPPAIESELNCVLAPLKEELLYRALLQKQLPRLVQKLRSYMPDAPKPGQRAAADGPRRFARLVASIAFGLAHLPATRKPQAWVVELPTAVAAGLSSFFCFGRLYDTRGLPAAVGAHAMHNAIVGAFLLLRIADARGVLPIPRMGLLVTVAVYTVTIIRGRQRMLLQRAG